MEYPMPRVRWSILVAIGLALGLTSPGLKASVVMHSQSIGEEASNEVPLELFAARLQLMQRLIELGRDPEEARRQAEALTEEDLIVLGANPNMMQTAGAKNAQATNFWLSLLLIAGFFALLAAGDGTFIQSS
jgi:hypothetical protein